MALEFLKLDDDLRALAQQASATMKLIADTVVEVQLLTRNADAAVTELRQAAAALGAGLTKGKP